MPAQVGIGVGRGVTTRRWNSPAYWYNPRHLFGHLGHVPPAEFEAHDDHKLHEPAMAA